MRFPHWKSRAAKEMTNCILKYSNYHNRYNRLMKRWGYRTVTSYVFIRWLMTPEYQLKWWYYKTTSILKGQDHEQTY